MNVTSQSIECGAIKGSVPQNNGKKCFSVEMSPEPACKNNVQHDRTNNLRTNDSYESVLFSESKCITSVFSVHSE